MIKIKNYKNEVLLEEKVIIPEKKENKYVSKRKSKKDKTLQSEDSSSTEEIEATE